MHQRDQKMHPDKGLYPERPERTSLFSFTEADGVGMEAVWRRCGGGMAAVWRQYGGGCTDAVCE